jgi:flagellar hook-length control protein FliK
MMTQPSGATGATAAGAAALVGAAGDGNDGAGVELQRAPGGAHPVLFSQALQALAGAEDLAGASGADAAGSTALATGSRSLTTAAGTGAAAVVAAAPTDGAESLPKDLLLALFAAEAAAPAAGTAPRKTDQAGSDDARAAAGVRELQGGNTNTDQAANAQAAAADPGAALLAAVLQWLQQQHVGASVASAASADSGSGRESAMDAANTTSGVTAAPIADNAKAIAGRADGAAAAGTMLAAAPGASLSSELASRRDSDGRAGGGDQPRAPANVADSVSGATAGANAGMDMAAALRAVSEASPAQLERSVAVPVHERHWPTALATQVLLLSNDKVQAATLRLSPEHLGPVEVRIDMQESTVNVSFTATHAETRAALEQALPQLRAVLAGAGLSLGQATVQQQARRESQNSNALPRTAGTADEPIEAPATLTRALGMIDEYV